MMPALLLVHARSPGLPVGGSRFARTDHAGTVLGFSIALLLGAITLDAMAGGRQQSANVAQPAAETVLVAPPSTPAQILSPPPPPAQAPPTLPPNHVGLSPADRARSVALIYDTSATGRTSPDRVPPLPARLSAAEWLALHSAGADDLAAAISAQPAPTLLTRGTVISAVLDAVFDPSTGADRLGPVRATITADVISRDGRRVLIPRGSRALGEVRRGLPGGVVQWTRLLRPDGLALVLGPPASEASGRGPEGGPVLMLSVIAPGPSASGSAGRPIRILAVRDLDFAGSDRRP